MRTSDGFTVTCWAEGDLDALGRPQAKNYKDVDGTFVHRLDYHEGRAYELCRRKWVAVPAAKFEHENWPDLAGETL
jgi:hypothetical protein